KKRAREIQEPAKRPKERLTRPQSAFDATAFGEEGIHETVSGLAKRLSPVKMSRENCWSKRAFGETSLRRSDLVSYYPSDGDRMCSTPLAMSAFFVKQQRSSSTFRPRD